MNNYSDSGNQKQTKYRFLDLSFTLLGKKEFHEASKVRFFKDRQAILMVIDELSAAIDEVKNHQQDINAYLSNISKFSSNYIDKKYIEMEIHHADKFLADSRAKLLNNENLDKKAFNYLGTYYINLKSSLLYKNMWFLFRNEPLEIEFSRDYITFLLENNTFISQHNFIDESDFFEPFAFIYELMEVKNMEDTDVYLTQLNKETALQVMNGFRHNKLLDNDLILQEEHRTFINLLEKVIHEDAYLICNYY